MRHFYLLQSILAFASCVLGNEQPTVSIPNGVLVGTTTSLYAATATVNKFLGIPYAAPPVRFEAPSPARDWTSPRNASSFGDICIQQLGQLSSITLDHGVDIAESEDCLYLNVFQPGGRVPDYGWPVMLWYVDDSHGLEYEALTKIEDSRRRPAIRQWKSTRVRRLQIRRLRGSHLGDVQLSAVHLRLSRSTRSPQFWLPGSTIRS